MPRVPGASRHLPRRLEPPQHVYLPGAVGDGAHAFNQPTSLQSFKHSSDGRLLQVGASAELLGPDPDVARRFDGLVDEHLLGGEALEACAVPGRGGLEDLAAVGGSVGAESVLKENFRGGGRVFFFFFKWAKKVKNDRMSNI